MEEFKVFFESYWKYGFIVTDEKGNSYTNEDQDGNSIYRLGIEKEMTMKKEGEKYFIEGTEFIKL